MLKQWKHVKWSEMVEFMRSQEASPVFTRDLCTFVPFQIKAEKYLSPEEKEEEERKKLEEQRRLAAKVCMPW